MVTQIDLTKCMAPKRKGSKIQCPYKQGEDSFFCGKHKNSSVRIDDILDKEKFITSKSVKNVVNSNSQKMNSPPIPKRVPKHLLLEDLDHMSHVYFQDLKLTLASMNMPKKGRKIELFRRLKSVLQRIYHCEMHPWQLVLMQRQIKKRLKQLRNRYRGIGVNCRELCNNIEDFFTLESVNDIPNNYFFSYRDNDNFLYGFDIRSFKVLVENNGFNPYNRMVIPERVIERMNKRMQLMERNNISLEMEDNGIILTDDQKIKNRVVLVFQKIDELNTAAGGVDVQWFMDLTMVQLKIFYKELEDIWSYRAELTQTMKNNIVPSGDIFKKSVSQVYHDFSKYSVRNYIIGEIDKLVASGVSEEDQNLGALWVLTALVIVSPSCSSALPWLIQI